jgi:hypothetical protein
MVLTAGARASCKTTLHHQHLLFLAPRLLMSRVAAAGMLTKKGNEVSLQGKSMSSPLLLPRSGRANNRLRLLVAFRHLIRMQLHLLPLHTARTLVAHMNGNHLFPLALRLRLMVQPRA